MTQPVSQKEFMETLTDKVSRLVTAAIATGEHDLMKEAVDIQQFLLSNRNRRKVYTAAERHEMTTQADVMLAEGHKLAEVADKLGVHYTTLTGWMTKRFQ